MTPVDFSGRKIAIITGASLAWNPRALKEASALTQCGAKVTVIGSSNTAERLFVDSEIAKSRGFEFISVGARSNDRRLRWIFPWVKTAVQRKISDVMFRKIGLESQTQICASRTEIYRKAIATKSDYFIGHLEAGLCTCLMIHRDGYRVGFDIEDWISEDLTAEARNLRPIKLIHSLEKSVLSISKHLTCPSLAMGSRIQSEYHCKIPTVVYNTFEWASRQRMDGRLQDRRCVDIPSIHWFSQTVGHGRGLEDLFACLPLLKHSCEIHLRGTPVRGFEDWLRSRVPPAWQSRVFVHKLVGNEELLSRISEHDIGMALEMKYCRSRDLTVTNKILQYLQGGLSVVASDTAGQREIAEKAVGAVELYPSGNHVALAAILNGLLGDADRLQASKRAALKAAETTFCWEQSSKHLLSAVHRGLTGEGEDAP
jgi:hypothetical protein